MMKQNIMVRISPTRILHTMIRVSDLDRSLKFYVDVLGMREFRREVFTEGRFTLSFIGYGEEANQAVIELTHNWDDTEYMHGTGYGHIALAVADIHATCEYISNLGAKITREPSPMSFAVDETGVREVIAFIEDPDGNRIELIEI